MSFFEQKPYLIAEIGVNHNGKLSLALDSIKLAAKSGANAVKFQIFDANEFMSKTNLKYEYKTKRGRKKENMFKMFKRLEFSSKWLKKILKVCKDYKVDFMSSAADIQSAKMLNDLNVKAIKLSSEDLINYPLLEYVASLKRKTILSTGMADESEIDRAVNIFRAKKTNFMLLHCVSVYPTPKNETNLMRMCKLSEKYKVEVGYSDHTLGIEASAGAVALGASVIEKHFTPNKNLIGPDHLMSMNPNEFKQLAQTVRNVYLMLGSEKIVPSKSEKKLRKVFRRSITALKSIKKGEILTKFNIGLKRPAFGIHPKFLKKIYGKKINKSINKEKKINFKDLI